MNPDESQFQAHAAFLVESGRSPFELSAMGAYPIGLHVVATRLFGPYSIWSLRVLILFVSLTYAILIYRTACTYTSRWYGLIGGILFLYLNLYYEGFSVAREWLSGLFVFLGLFIYQSSAVEIDPPVVARWWRRKSTGLFFCGMLMSAGVFFKPQAVPMVFVVPALQVIHAIARKEWKAPSRSVLTYLSGALLGGLLMLAPLLIFGNTFGKWSEIITFAAAYVFKTSEVRTSRGPLTILTLFWDKFFYTIPFGTIVLVAILFSTCTLIIRFSRLLQRAQTEDATIHRDGYLLLVSLWFIAACVSVQAGFRFFDHYYLYLLPPAILLVVSALYSLNAVIKHLFVRTLVMVVCVVYASNIALPVHYYRVARDPLSLVQFGEYLRSFAGPKNRIFVWGWRPEYYAYSRLTPSSQFTICAAVVGDYVGGADHCELDAEAFDILVADLEQYPPAVFIDATKVSLSMSGDNATTYGIDRYPPLQRYINNRYVRAFEIGRCVFYVPIKR